VPRRNPAHWLPLLLTDLSPKLPQQTKLCFKTLIQIIRLLDEQWIPCPMILNVLGVYLRRCP
jgi:hypothetical protein